MTTPNCLTCGHSIRGTSAGRESSACANLHNQDGGIARAPICKTLGLHETPEQIRERSQHEAIEAREKLINEIGYESPRRGEMRALGVKK